MKDDYSNEREIYDKLKVLKFFYFPFCKSKSEIKREVKLKIKKKFFLLN
jgi:hypothetical protein